MEDKLKHGAEGFMVALVFCAVYWAVGLAVYNVLGREIRTTTGYIVCVGGAFLTRRLVITLFS